MINKLYEQTKSFFKQNIKFLILFVILLFLTTFKLPFYIDGPGGLLNVNDKVNIENSYSINGSINLSYVSEMHATIPTYLFALLNKNYDIISKEELKYDNETYEDALYRNYLLLEESVNNATIVAYKATNKEAKINKTKVYVTYIDDSAETDLKIKDEIVKINDIEIKDKNHLYEILKNYKENEVINITVKNNNIEYMRTAVMKKTDDRVVIGILVTELYDLETTPNIEFNFDSKETGPSGGLMLSLAIYDYLTEEDLTKGRIIVGTGTIDKDGNVGSIGGVKYKLKGAVKNNADIFIVPTGENYEEVIKLVDENHYNIEIIEADTFYNVIEKLKN